ncbi:hypothetical protein D1632_10760 [Chryseobacterium nematophagum]|uniref:Uncharacterized protein n=1 Tax=Chryseobacterium nematophagum TaxID=2305228 RepID=A0A3M7LBB0_9FLAO|nr:hypothetical protein [Chryseobacterium nematophagum]RMZ60061.1 hypothetical protein D1632_10760 [Chryseobacterium nematophagum]
MITEIWIDGKPLDLYTDTNVRHTLQVNDITEVKDRQASYTNSFSIPKTPNNIQILGGLGIPSDTSRAPYQKPDCKMKIEGFDFLVKGWINVTETSDDYKTYVYSGIINFFKAIENKTLGNDLDLTEIDHTKDLDTVIQSFSNTNYKYLITDYNGLTHYGTGDNTINIDHLVPSVSVQYLWNKIRDTFGFDYSGSIFSTDAFTNLWLTYPKYIAIDVLIPITENSGSKFIGNTNIPTSDPNLRYGPLLVSGYANNQYFIAPEDGNYKLTFHVEITTEYSNELMIKYLLCINQENINYDSRTYTTLIVTNFTSQTQDVTLIVPLNSGDRVSFFNWHPNPNGHIQWNSAYAIKWELFDEGDVSFSQELKDFSIKDFVKEILTQFGLTMFPDEFSSTIEYVTLGERINDAEVMDWSEKYRERSSESYVYESYGQQNIFSYQYHDKESNYNDGTLKIANENLGDKKEVFKSKTYSPERDFVKFKINDSLDETVKMFKLYDKNVNERNGQIEIEYKGLEKRFHFVRERSLTADANIGSRVLQQEQMLSSLPLADFQGLDWVSLLQKNYNVFGQILNDSRVHDIELNLNFIDYLTIDLRKLYFFEQEQQYYILNKLQFDNTTSKGEFIRVKRYYDDADITDPTDPNQPFVSIVWEDNTNTPKTGTASLIEVQIDSSYSQNNDPFISFEWEKSEDNINWTSLLTGVSPYDIPLSGGIQWIRMKVIAESGNIIYSNKLQYEKFIIVCKRYHVWAADYQGIDELVIDYINCDGVAVHVAVSGPFGYHEYTMCASENSINTNGTIEDLGGC